MKKIAIIVAGGMGVRAGGGVPKQFLPLKGRPVLFHTLEKFHGLVDEIVLVLPGSHIPFWKDLCFEYEFNLKLKLVTGGATRTESVLNGLKSVDNQGVVAIHDAVRPLVSRKLIENLLSEASVHGNAIPAIPVRESMRLKSDGKNSAINREDFVTVQTPQCFDYQLISSAYQKANGQLFSDDASVIDFVGGEIHLVEGETSNIKITFREDILFAEALLEATEL